MIQKISVEFSKDGWTNISKIQVDKSEILNETNLEQTDERRVSQKKNSSAKFLDVVDCQIPSPSEWIFTQISKEGN